MTLLLDVLQNLVRCLKIFQVLETYYSKRIELIFLLLYFAAPPPVPINPCDTLNCGNNAYCAAYDGVARCNCITPYIGDPYSGCRPECTMDSDCNNNLACINQHCINPCQGICGLNSVCEVINHIPICSCEPGLTGDPFRRCIKEPAGKIIIFEQIYYFYLFFTKKIVEMYYFFFLVSKIAPCSPSPCGPYSICQVQGNRAVCSCSPGYRGTPPSCRPECLVSTECAPSLSCINQKCIDPCENSCGLNANCIVNYHKPLCSCPRGFVGDPFIQCLKDGE